MFRRALTTALAAASLMLCLPIVAPAQSTALLRGTVTDPSSAVIPGAEVVCRNLDTGREIRAITGTAGLFQFPDLPVGPYELKLSRQGFATLVRGGIELLTGQTVDLTLTLEWDGALAIGGGHRACAAGAKHQLRDCRPPWTAAR